MKPWCLCMSVCVRACTWVNACVVHASMCLRDCLSECLCLCVCVCVCVCKISLLNLYVCTQLINISSDKSSVNSYQINHAIVKRIHGCNQLCMQVFTNITTNIL